MFEIFFIHDDSLSNDLIKIWQRNFPRRQPVVQILNFKIRFWFHGREMCNEKFDFDQKWWKSFMAWSEKTCPNKFKNFYRVTVIARKCATCLLLLHTLEFAFLNCTALKTEAVTSLPSNEIERSSTYTEMRLFCGHQKCFKQNTVTS